MVEASPFEICCHRNGECKWPFNVILYIAAFIYFLPFIIIAFTLLIMDALGAGETIQQYLRQICYNLGERVVEELVLIAGGVALVAESGRLRPSAVAS